MGEVETRLLWMLISNISGFFICTGLGRFISDRKKGVKDSNEITLADRLKKIKQELENMERDIKS
ncbi:MAG: hypothetical protein KA251_06760 [Saprospiraceae bacterium]|nr:hypothetical protein [Candidatus Vicinibacter affinis]MBP6172714.1 hypothetical protein [Saprospiraceae bacterium]MBK6573464.1 hypothetical protein [Candidatus Vicinibacter affinis]MBK6822058.1 hypothetical protein [Candidatus Vicinibacter affinis]MBK7302145.1 hypothetical protein [Candidatus Vicinibacter affinis]